MSDIYARGTRVWFPDKEDGWISGEVTVATKTDDGKVKLVFVDERGREHAVDTSENDIRDGKGDLPPLRNPPLLESADDMATLSHLNEPSVLHTIRNRYSQHIIYTYSGIVLIAVNPFQRVTLYGPEIIQAYSGRKKGELEPHLFAIAEEAYTRMRQDGMGQTIIVSGESGAGKTESAKLIMRYLASVNADASGIGSKTRIKGADETSEVERQILATNPILEAFGNAKTSRNDNSSRFGKYIQILFDGKQQIVGARIRTYLLERSRLVYQPETERNYHIFYQLCAGVPMKERKDLALDSDITKFAYMSQGGPTSTPIPGVDDVEEFRQTQQALSTVGISIDRQWAVFKILAALLHLGNVKITQSRSDAMLDDKDPALALCTRFLGISPVEFKKWIVKKQLTTRNEKIVTSLNGAQATVVRDSVAKFIYACLFEWLVSIVNESLAGEDGEAANRAENFIGVLDIYGFEHFKKNSFEQFCINYANEKLQQEFNAHVFKLEQEEYVREQIHWTFIDFADNQPCIDIIENRLGILSLLDEESRLPSGTDASFLTKLVGQLDKPENKSVFKKSRFGNTAFTVAHYALDVTYEVEGFIEKNRDTVPDEQLMLLANTQNYFFKEVLEAAMASSKPGDGGTPTPGGGSDTESVVSNRRQSLIPDPGRASLTTGMGSSSGGGKGGRAVARKPTLGSIFKGSLISLMETIGVTNVHYIRCIKPNELKRAWEFAPQQVLGQLRACGVLETIRISCAGYPSRWTYEEFAERYYMLVPSGVWSKETDPKNLCSEILKAAIKDEDKYQAGLTKIFFRAGMLAYLEAQRTDRLNYLVTIIQKNMRRRMAVKKYQDMRLSAIRIQAWWRTILARRLVHRMRQEAAAVRFQKAIRRYLQRQHFMQVRQSVIRFQSLFRGQKARREYQDARLQTAAVALQRLFRGFLARRTYKSDVKKVIYLQSCVRRRNARKELKALRQEARSASRFKEISYRLENKVVELTQTIQKRVAENKELAAKNEEVQAMLRTWMSRHEEADAKARQYQTDIQNGHVPKAKFEELLSHKRDVDQRLDAVQQKVSEQDELIQQLTDDLGRHTTLLEERQRLLDGAMQKGTEDNTTILSLRNELSGLRDQLNRANAFNSLTKGTREQPGSPTADRFPPAYKAVEPAPLTNGNAANGTKRHNRTHSAAPFYNTDKQENGYDDVLHFARRQAAGTPRAASMAMTGQDGLPRFKPMNGLSEIYDDPAEEKIRLLEDGTALDEDILNSLIRGLKIPQPGTTPPPNPKETLFPAHLISLVTNEMWRFGLIAESERFLANVMQTIQSHVMSFSGEDAIIPGIFWLSNVHEVLSFICVAESDMQQGIGPGGDPACRDFDWQDYERLVSVVKNDLDSLEFNIYHTFMVETKKRLSKMIIPALIESQALPGFTATDGNNRLFNRLLHSSQPAFNMDDILNLFNKVYRSLKSFYVEEIVIGQVFTELLRLVGVTSFNDLLMRRNFSSWKRAMQIQYNITRIEEWCKSHDMPEGNLQLEHLMQATKLLQLKKATAQDIEIIYDVCWMLTPTQIQRMCTNYFVADYENPISPEILRVVASRIVPNDRNDHLLLTPETEEVGPYELPLPREVTGLETYVPAYLSTPHIRRLAALVS